MLRTHGPMALPDLAARLATEGHQLTEGRDLTEDLEALDAWMAEAEERWVDERIPALDDLTPGEAAADPTRRGDLEALLDEFPPADAMPGPGRGMDPGRLRRLLGLDT